MRKLILAASAGAIGFMIALSPASALTSYQIQTNGGANFNGTNQSDSGGLTINSTTTEQSGLGYGYGQPTTTNNFNSSSSQQEDLSRDMSWQGTGYYLRPNR